MTIEHFLIAGSQRSGTTFLYSLLDRHPEIEMLRPLRPEPKFFLTEPHTLSEYQQRFHRNPHARARGEKSTSYMDREEMPAAAASVIPGIKAIFILRDPVARAISNYRFSVENGVESDDAETALRIGRKPPHFSSGAFSTSPFEYLARGHYYRALDRWERILGRDQMYLLCFEALISQPDTVREVFRWLGVSVDLDLQVPTKAVNSSHTPAAISNSLRRNLVDHFHESNQILLERYGFDVSLWAQ
ncbi:MAG: sulfotransferase family protein [Thermoanaerobaculia bacterium]